VDNFYLFIKVSVVYLYPNQNKSKMKKLILLISIVSTFVGCTSNQSTARKKIQEYVLKNANDANSYEFIEMDNPDTIRKSGELFHLIEKDSLELKSSPEALHYSDFINIYESEPPSIEHTSHIFFERLKIWNDSLTTLLINNINKNTILYNKIKNTESDSIVGITHRCNFRIRIPSGGLIKTYALITYYPTPKDWSEVYVDDYLSK
jgi:hypothetical protein